MVRSARSRCCHRAPAGNSERSSSAPSAPTRWRGAPRAENGALQSTSSGARKNKLTTTYQAVEDLVQLVSLLFLGHLPRLHERGKTSRSLTLSHLKRAGRRA